MEARAEGVDAVTAVARVSGVDWPFALDRVMNVTIPPSETPTSR
jgi:hypothetical protein